MPLRAQVDARIASEPKRLVCVEFADRNHDRPAGLVFRPWDALPVIVPWIRFESAFFSGSSDQPELMMVFAGYRITAHGTDLIELVVPLREQRVIGLRALPVGYGDDHRREKTRITALMIEESDKALEISPNHLKG